MRRKVKRPSIVKTTESLHKATMAYILAKEENRQNGKTENRVINGKFITMEEELKDAIAVFGKAKKTLQDERELEETIDFAKSLIQKNSKITNNHPPSAYQPAETDKIDDSFKSPISSPKPTSTSVDFQYAQEAAAIAREEEAIAIAEARASLRRQEEELHRQRRHLDEREHFNEQRRQLDKRRAQNEQQRQVRAQTSDSAISSCLHEDNEEQDDTDVTFSTDHEAVANFNQQPATKQDLRSKPTAGGQMTNQSPFSARTILLDSRKQQQRQHSIGSDQQINKPQRPERTSFLNRCQPTMDQNHRVKPSTDKQNPVNKHPISKTIFLASANKPQGHSNRPDHQINRPPQSAPVWGKSPQSPPRYHQQAQSQWRKTPSTRNNTFPNDKRGSPSVNAYSATVSTNNSRNSRYNKHASAGGQGQSYQNLMSGKNSYIHSANAIPNYRHSRHSLMQISSRGSSMTSMSSLSSRITSTSPQSCLSSNSIHRRYRNSSMFASSRGSSISSRISAASPQSCFS